jgi:hypothetical protein
LEPWAFIYEFKELAPSHVYGKSRFLYMDLLDVDKYNKESGHTFTNVICNGMKGTIKKENDLNLEMHIIPNSM